MPNAKDVLLELLSAYLVITTDTFRIYEIDRKDLGTAKWFLEMIWSVSENYDVRFVAEEGKLKIFFRTEERNWKLHV